jgi:flavin-dependent dehydrogenase
MFNFDNEVTIIGGGPAGSAAAINLAVLGFDVCIIEKKNFPRETLCGEFLSLEVIENLKRFKIYEEFISLCPNPIKYLRLINNDGKEISASLNFPAFGLRRSVFDNLLFETAKANNIKVIQPAEVKEIRREGKSFVLKIKNENAEEFYLRSGYVIAAYGKQNILDKSLNRSFVNYKSNLNGVKLHINSGLFQEFDREEIRIYLSDGIYCGINAVDNNYITVCFLEYRNKLSSSSRKNLLNQISDSLKFRNLFKSGYEEFIKSKTVYGTGNIFFGKRNTTENGVFMIGDSAGVIAPITGDGIGMAFQSAKIISQILGNVRSGEYSIKEAENRYRSGWNSLFRKRIYVSYIIQKLIMNNYGRILSVNILNNFPQALPYFIEVTRG